jgi:hypothetical protein
MNDPNAALTPYESRPLAEVPAAVEAYLARIRPEWQARPLVERVRKLLPVDPSSACQRLLNAAGHDLRAKIRTLGLDLAGEAARAFGLPGINNNEDLEDYPTAHLYDLAYRVALLTRADWRRMHRAYEIRRDLEHEDDEYEASPADLYYVFEAAIDVVLSRPPTQVIQLREIEEVVESTAPVYVPSDLIQDFKDAPPQRQSEILHRLAFWSMELDRPELVRANSYRLLRQFAPLSPTHAKIELAKKLEQSIGRRPVTVETAQVALASGAYPFIHQRQQHLITRALVARFDEVKPGWRYHHEHAELLDEFVQAGGFAICPPGAERRVVRWCVEAYVGEPGRYGTWGRNRPVFFSDSAAPRIEKLLQQADETIKGHVQYVAMEPNTRKLVRIPEQEERLQRLVELTASDSPG